MANSTSILSSILDLLIDHNPSQQKNIEKQLYQSPHEFLQSIRRDLENLLNTRKYHFFYPISYHDLNKSLLNYGITDLYTNSSTSEIMQQKFCQYLTQIIQRYEPRLKEINVILKKPVVNFELVIFISGVLHAELDTKMINFNYILT